MVQGRARVPACVRGLGWPSRPTLGAKLSPKASLRWPSSLQSWPGATMLGQKWGDSVSASLGTGLGPSPAPAPHTVTQQYTTDKSQPRARCRAADRDHRKGVPSAGGLTSQAPPHRPPAPRGGLWEGHRTHSSQPAGGGEGGPSFHRRPGGPLVLLASYPFPGSTEADHRVDTGWVCLSTAWGSGSRPISHEQRPPFPVGGRHTTPSCTGLSPETPAWSGADGT